MCVDSLCIPVELTVVPTHDVTPCILIVYVGIIMSLSCVWGEIILLPHCPSSQGSVWLLFVLVFWFHCGGRFWFHCGGRF